MHKEPTPNKRKSAPKPQGYGTTKNDLYDLVHHKKAPILTGKMLGEVTGNMSNDGTVFYSDEESVDYWKNKLAPNAEWTLYETRSDVTGACECTTREIIEYEIPYSYSSMNILTCTVALKNKKIWIPSELAPAILAHRGWVCILTPIICTDFERLNSVKEDLRMENRSAVHVRRRTVLLEEANDFGGWFQ